MSRFTLRRASATEPPPSARHGQNDCQIVVGRKNHYGSHSKRGAEVAAILYTLFESTKLAGIDAHRYVLEATRRAIASR